MKNTINGFRRFYPAYIAAHSNRTNRILHFTGTSLFFLLLSISIITTNWWIAPAAVFCGYFFAGIGHHHFEGNKSFRGSRPVFCIAGSLLLYLHIWRHGFRMNG